MKVFTIKINNLFILFILAGILAPFFTANAQNEDVWSVMDEQKQDYVALKSPTQIGVSGNVAFHMEGVAETIATQYWSVGPGIFFDYFLSEEFTLSADVYYIYSMSGVINSDFLLPGIYLKHWINPDWGYFGLGLQAGLKNLSADPKYFLDLTLILTGENVFVSREMNTCGDFRASFSLFQNYTTTPGISIRLQYTIGLAWRL